MSESDFISVADAIRILDAAPVSPRVQRVHLRKALGRRLAEDITSDRDYPPFDKAVMDGYAIRATDVNIAGVGLRVVDTVAAGVVGQRTISAGEVAAIMTGAPLPPGADTVVPVEDTTRQLDLVTFHRPAKPGAAIARRASDIESGRVVLTRGTRLGPAHIALAANVGAGEVAVYERPIVTVLATGDELIEVDQQPAGAQIRNANSPMLIALLDRLGCEVLDLGIVRDDPDATRDALSQGMLADALLVTGGMSMGERDYVPRLLRELGLEMKITKLRIKPGKPFVFAVGQGSGVGGQDPDSSTARYVFGLPGNPVSAFVCTVRLAARVLSRMGGGDADAAIAQAKLISALPANGPREFYQPAIRTGLRVEPLQWKSSADIFTLANANALIIRPEHAPPAVAGDLVSMIDLNNI